MQFVYNVINDLIKVHNNSPLNVEIYYAVIIFFRMTQLYRVDEGRSKHLAASLVLWLYVFSTIS